LKTSSGRILALILGINVFGTAAVSQSGQVGVADRFALTAVWRLVKFGDRAVTEPIRLYLSATSWFVVVEYPETGKYLAVGGPCAVSGAEIKLQAFDDSIEYVPFLWLPDSLIDTAKESSGGGLRSEWQWLKSSPRYTLTGESALSLHGGRPGDKALTFERLPENTLGEIAGTWVPRKDDSTKTFDVPPETWILGSDGSFASKKRTFGRETESKGKLRISGRLLVVKPDGWDETLYPFAYYEFADGRTGSILLVRPSTGKPWLFHWSAGGGGAAAPPMAGSWVATDATGEIRVAFSPDGSYTREVRQGSRVLESSSGTWRIEGTTLIAEDKQEGTLKLPFRLDDPNLLQLTIAGDPVIFKRGAESAGGGGAAGREGAGGLPAAVGGGGGAGGTSASSGGGDAGKAAATKAALQATWTGVLENVFSIPSGSLTLTFLENGRFEGAWVLGAGAAFPQTGKWKIAGSQLILENDFGPPTMLTFRLEGNSLTLDSFPTMKPATLYRQ
jgi:hypothetical protein